MEQPILIGATAPVFHVKDQYANMVSLNDFRGKNVLLSWHPLAFTPVCTEQMKSLEANYTRLLDLNTVPLGFSVDPDPSKKAWGKELQITNLKMPSDFWPHGAVAKAYGLFRELQGFSERANVLIDGNGKIMWIKVYNMPDLPDIEEVIQVLKKS